MTSSNTNGVSVDYQFDDLNRLSAVVDNRPSSGALGDPAPECAALFPGGIAGSGGERQNRVSLEVRATRTGEGLFNREGVDSQSPSTIGQ